ncbi:MAG: hypothetical protein IPM33_02070 [Phycisphaerales bacterium]|nr:hypothetical protein [Phycisphaerales bacterium]
MLRKSKHTTTQSNPHPGYIEEVEEDNPLRTSEPAERLTRFLGSIGDRHPAELAHRLGMSPDRLKSLAAEHYVGRFQSIARATEFMYCYSFHHEERRRRWDVRPFLDFKAMGLDLARRQSVVTTRAGGWVHVFEPEER